MANPPDALLTRGEIGEILRDVVAVVILGDDAAAICAAQHAKTLMWLADRIANGQGDCGDDHALALLQFADELRALADGRGEGNR